MKALTQRDKILKMYAFKLWTKHFSWLFWKPSESISQFI